MRFLVDAQLFPALPVDASIITKDEDFAHRKMISDGGPTIVWIRTPNTRRQALLTMFEKVLPDLFIALDRGEMLIEIV